MKNEIYEEFDKLKSQTIELSEQTAIESKKVKRERSDLMIQLEQFNGQLSEFRRQSAL